MRSDVTLDRDSRRPFGGGPTFAESEGNGPKCRRKIDIGLSPLCIVTTKTICDLLIENGAEVDHQTSNGQTPMFCACIRGNLEI
uniref:ANK_REP_REGION domain-containing protein n=1 Tax=Globodera pallida TaxID=36090 RepID=A0A183CRI1_GLOPA